MRNPLTCVHGVHLSSSCDACAKLQKRWASTDLDWERAYEHLQYVRKNYVEIGVSGVPALNLVLNPLVVRYERGERTQELYDEMMSTE